jgi:hypothetical protein
LKHGKVNEGISEHLATFRRRLPSRAEEAA